MPISGLDALQAQLAQLQQTVPADLKVLVRREMEQSAKAIAAATPRSAIRHAHMQDTYSVTQSGNTTNLVNSRPYTQPVFEAQRKSPGAQARQKKLRAAAQAEADRLADALGGFGVVVEQKLGKP